jgi:hypothetical protein
MQAALLFGSPGYRPFAGHFRGHSTVAGVSLAWAGRLGGGLDAPAAWEAAEAARAAMAEWPGGDHPMDGLSQAWLCLHRMDGRWHKNRDLSLLLVCSMDDQTMLSACGLSQIFNWTGNGLRPFLPPTHALLTLPGLPDAPAVFPSTAGTFYGQIHNVPLIGGDLDLACGVR